MLTYTTGWNGGSKLHAPAPGPPSVSTGLVVPVRFRLSTSPGATVGALPFTLMVVVACGDTVKVSLFVLPTRKVPPGAVYTPETVAAPPSGSALPESTFTVIVVAAETFP